MKKLIALSATLAALILLASCGEGGGETTAASAPGSAQVPPAQRQEGSEQDGNGSQGKAADQDVEDGGASSGPAADDSSAGFTPPTHHDFPTGAAQFETKGGDNSIQEFGIEAPEADFDAAAIALHGFLDARAAGAWRDTCSYMSTAVGASLIQLSGHSRGASCPDALASLATDLPPAALREAAVAEAAALRVEGDRAFLLFQGARGTAYFMPMAREGGTWKVAAVAPSALL